LETYSANSEEEVDERSPEASALRHLRAIKPAILASGDRKAIDSYNTAINKLKRRMRDNQVVALDVSNGKNGGMRLQDMARCSHRKGLAQGKAAYREAQSKSASG